MEHFELLCNKTAGLVNRIVGSEEQKELVTEYILFLVSLGVEMSDSDENFKNKLKEYVKETGKKHKSK